MIEKIIKQRISTRAFSNREIEQEKLQLIFEASRWAASSMNEQPWRYIYRSKHENKDSYNELYNTLTDGNKSWAGNAPLLIAVLAKTHFDYKDRPNRHYMYDTGQSVATMLLQLTDLGLVAHQMGGFYMDQAKSVLSVDDRFEIATIIAVGYPGELESLTEDLQQRENMPRNRKHLDEILYKEKLS